MDVVRIAAPLLADMARGAVVRRGALSGGLAFLAGLAGLTAAGCAVAALWIYMVPIVGAGAAPLVCAGVLLVLAGLCLVIGKLARRRPSAPDDLLQLLGQLDLPGFFGEHKASLLIGAMVAGLVAGSGAGKRPRR